MKYNENIKGKLKRYFTDNIDLKNSTNGFMRGNCPLCGGRATFGINVKLGKANCFKCAEAKTSLLNLLRVMQGLSTRDEVVSFLNLQEDYTDLFQGPKEKKKDRVIKQIELPKEYQLITQGDDVYARSARNYLIKKRGFNLKALANAGVGFCNAGKYEGYIIIPYFVMGKLVYFNARRYMLSGPKFNNPPEEEFGVGKVTMIYNQDALFMYERCFLVESATNALTLGPAGVGFGGKSLSPYQVSMVIKSPIEKAVILLDPDAIKETIKLALRLCNYKKTKVVTLPDGQDVNSLGKDKTWEAIKQSPYKDYKGFYKDYLKLKQGW